MSELNQAFQKIGISSLQLINDHPQLWQQFLQQHSVLFTKVKQHKPNAADESHLLGILTKAHIECLSSVELNQKAVKTMWQALNKTLGAEYAKNFEYQDFHMLILVTHVWLYVQGYLKMDFSLANDHADATAKTMRELSNSDTNKIRAQFLASFYLGNKSSPIASNRISIWNWLKNNFG